MLPKKMYKELKEELDNCSNPLFIYDDDPDGLCSFLILYRYKKEGNGVFVKSVPKVTANFLKQVEKYNPDKVFLLDMPEVDEEFFAGVKIPIIWVDHHPHSHPPHVKSFNPREQNYEKHDTSTTALCYNTIKEDLWIAAVGAVGDWSLPDYMEEFTEKYPDLMPKGITNPPQALFDTKLSKLVQIFAMCLKGDTNTSKKCVKAITKINDPYDLLNGESEEAKYILRKTKRSIEEYENLLQRALAVKAKNGVIEFYYDADENSFSAEVSNHVQYKNPDKFVIIGRKKSGDYKISLRAQNLDINPILEKALVGINGYGGGHEHACGACVDELQFENFLTVLKEGIKEAKKG